MKIAFIGQKGMPDVQGGVETHVEDLSIALAQRGNNDVYVYTRTNYVDPSLTQYKGVQLISLPTINSKHLDAIVHTFLACLDVSFRHNMDIIHFHSIGPSSLLWIVKLLNPRTPVIATFHSRCYLHVKWNWIAQQYLKFGEWMACRFASRTIVISRILEQFVRENYYRKTAFIPNGVDLEPSLATDQLKQWNIAHGEYILYVGRLIRTKRVHDLIIAYNKTTTFKKLVIVGEGSFSSDYVAYLHKLANGNKNIVFTGTQTGETLRQLYTHAYIFVLPSEIEGVSISLLEAFSCGTPVLASDIAENKDIVLGRGFAFAVGDPDDCAHKMQELVNDPSTAKQYRMVAQRDVQLQYNWDILAECIEYLYFDAIDEKRSGLLHFFGRTH